MARPYSKKTVDQAEEICLCAANNNFDTSVLALGLDAFAAELGVPQHATALRLAFAAYKEVPKVGSFQMIALEAAELIRSGWMIGDPIELLTVSSNVTASDDDSITVPNVCLDKPIDMSAMVDKYKTEECSTFAAANAVLATVDEQTFAMSSKDYTDEVGATIDDGPVEVDQVALADDTGYPADPPVYNGDYGADS